MLSVAMASNGEYDREFITGVLSTGIYCLPSCRARKPKPENVRFFQTIEQAKEAGLRACKKCRPDDFFLGVDADLDRLEMVVSRLRENPGQCSGIDDLCATAGVGSSKLFESIRSHYHSTPGDLISRTRVDLACRKLIEGSDGVADIAFEVGFETLSTFYDHFGRLTGMAPTAYRKLPLCRSFTISLPDNFQPEIVLGYYGRDPLSLSESVTGDEVAISAVAGGAPMVVQIAICGGEAECRFEGGDPLTAHKAAVRVLGLKEDPKGFEQLATKLGHQRLFEGRSGLRIPLTASLYDGVVWSILGQQVNLTFAYSLRRRLTELVGIRISDQLVSPPQPESVAQLSVSDLLPLQFSQRKAEYLIDFSRQIADGSVSLEDLEKRSATHVEKTLLGVRGLGPWSVNYLMMRAFGFADCLPIGDTGITSALQRFYSLDVRPNAAVTKELLAPFSPHRSLACLHLWQSLKFES